MDPASDPDDPVADTLASAANERTSMAWNRTALSWAAVGAIVVRYHATDGLWSRATVPGYVMLALGAVVFVAGAVRYTRRDRALRLEGRFPEPARLLALVSVTTTLAVAAVAAIEISRLV